MLYLHLMTNIMQKIKILFDSFQRYWWLNNPAIWLGKRHIWPQPSSHSSSLRCYFSLMIISMQKNLRYRWLFPEIERYWCSKSPAVIFPQTCGFCRIIKNIVMLHFYGKKRHQWTKFLAKTKKPYLKGGFRLFPQNENLHGMKLLNEFVQ